MIIFLVALDVANVLQLETALIFSGRIRLVCELLLLSWLDDALA